MKKISFILLFLLPFLFQAQDWPIYGTPDWPNYQKDWPSHHKDLNDTCDVIPLGVDFGLCAMPLGWALSDSGCVVLLNCIDSSLIDIQVLCPGVIDPVCGCDSFTYQNSCQAMYYYGVSSFYQGECVTSRVQEPFSGTISVFPNPSNGLLHIDHLPMNSKISCSDLLGKEVFQMTTSQKSIQMELGFLPKGCYLLTVNGFLVEKLLIE